MKKRIKDLGKKLGVSDKDVKNIKKVRFSRRILYWLVGLLVVVISYVAGFFYGKGSCPEVISGGTPPPPVSPPGGGGGGGLPLGYPFAIAVATNTLTVKKKKSTIAILFLSALAFFVAIKAAPIFGEAIKYNVYKKT